MDTNVVSLLVVVSLLLSSSQTIEMAVGKTPPAIFIFGDSTADVGNNNYLPGAGNDNRANFPHNGIDFPGGVPTGRFCNGYNFVDLLAQMMGFDKSPPPALSITEEKQAFKGVNFASGGSGILDVTGQNQSLSMNTQIMLFNRTTDILIQALGKKSTDLLLSRSIFIFSTGNNDIFGFYAMFANQTKNQKKKFISMLTSDYKGQLKVLYKLGARKFAVMGSGNLGCVPAERSSGASGGCVDELNNLSKMFNKALKEDVLPKLALESEGVKFSFVDLYAIGSIVMARPHHFGFEETKAACCGGGKFNGQSACTPNATYCTNRQEYIFWDWVHPTQAAYRVLTKYAYDGSLSIAKPMNVGQLVRV